MSGLEVLAILTAFKDASEVIGKIYSMADRYHRFPRQIYGLKNRIIGCEMVFRSWRRKCGLEHRHSESYYRDKWGTNGWRAVTDSLALLVVIRDEMVEQINEFVCCATDSERRRIPRILFDEELVRLAKQNIQAISTNTRKWNRFKRACVDQASKIREQIDEFDVQFATLLRISESAEQETRDERVPTFGRPQPQNRVEQVTGRKSAFFDEQQNDAVLLHEAFKAGEKMDCFLGIMVVEETMVNITSPPRLTIRTRRPHQDRPSDRRPSNSRAVIKVTKGASLLQLPDPSPDEDHQVLLKTTSNGSEGILIQPKRFDSNKGTLKRNMYVASFSDSIERLRTKQPLPCELLPPSGSFEQGFLLWRSDSIELFELCSVESLDRQLRQWSKAEKTKTAHAISRGLFRILGSPWGDYIESWNLKARSSPRASLAALVHARPGNNEFTGMLERATDTLLDPDEQSKKHAQIYRLGVLLTELALSHQVDVAFSRQLGPRIVRDFNQSTVYSNENIASEVEAEMGHKYGDVVLFCLSVFEKPVAGDRINTFYVDRVLKPLQLLSIS